METQKIMNLLNDSSNEESKLLQKSGMFQTVKQQRVIKDYFEDGLWKVSPNIQLENNILILLFSKKCTCF